MRGRLMRSAVIRLTTSLIVCLLLITPVFVQAQAAPSKLVGVAVLPASTLADGPQAGQKLGGRTVNGLKTPFASQPVGNIESIVPVVLANYRLALTDSLLGNSYNSCTI